MQPCVERPVVSQHQPALSRSEESTLLLVSIGGNVIADRPINESRKEEGISGGGRFCASHDSRDVVLVTGIENSPRTVQKTKYQWWRSGKKEVPNSRFEARRRGPECSTSKVKKEDRGG